MEINVGDVKSFIDTLWVIDCAILVFIMQAGFMCVESGLSRHKNSINVALKNAADFVVVGVQFISLGVIGEILSRTYFASSKEKSYFIRWDSNDKE